MTFQLGPQMAPAQPNNRENDGLGYLNMALPNDRGGSTQIGSVRLVSTKSEQKDLYDFIRANGEDKALQLIKENLTISFYDLLAERPKFSLAG